MSSEKEKPKGSRNCLMLALQMRADANKAADKHMMEPEKQIHVVNPKTFARNKRALEAAFNQHTGGISKE